MKMTKSDLRTGMIATLRNGEEYYVMLHTGLFGRQDSVLVHRVGDDMGWMPLALYDEDMTFHDDPDGVIPGTPDLDREWDIMAVDAVRNVTQLFTGSNYKTIWMRKEDA